MGSKGKGRSAPRGPQGKRLKAWVHVKKGELFTFMKSEGVSAAAIADALGCSTTLVSRWKAGDRVPSEVAQKTLRRVLDGELMVKRGGQGYGASAPASPFDGARLRAWRQTRGLSRRALAERLGVSVGSIFGWETGGTEPRGANREALDKLLAKEAPGGEDGSRTEAAAIRAAGQVLAAYVAANEVGLEELPELAGRLRVAFGGAA